MNLLKFPLMAASLALALASCSGSGKKEAQLTASGLDPKNFQTEIDGKKTDLYVLRNADGMEVCVTNYGGRIVSIMVPDRDGNLRDVVLGFDSIADYQRENHETDFGAAIGRYANRIKGGTYPCDTGMVVLPTNNVKGPDGEFLHSLHGGPTGWQYQVYNVESANDSTITLSIDSPDGDNGFPGNVKAYVTYTLTPDNAIDIAYSATTDAPTVINMTNHSYFNLNGDPDKTITDNVLWINANEYTPIDSTYIPVGEMVEVGGTPFDFTEYKIIGQDINADFDQIKNGNGYDHNWVLATDNNVEVAAAELISPETGIKLTVYTDEPGIQVYTGNFLDGTLTGKGGKTYAQRSAICLETQHYPDSPNHQNEEGWPSVVLTPENPYSSHCIYKFTVEQ